MYCYMQKLVKRFNHLAMLKVEKNFFCHKAPIFLKDVDIEKELVSNKISFVENTLLYWLLV